MAVSIDWHGLQISAITISCVASPTPAAAASRQTYPAVQLRCQINHCLLPGAERSACLIMLVTAAVKCLQHPGPYATGTQHRHQWQCTGSVGIGMACEAVQSCTTHITVLWPHICTSVHPCPCVCSTVPVQSTPTQQQGTNGSTTRSPTHCHWATSMLQMSRCNRFTAARRSAACAEVVNTHTHI
jgi:hypothetical protein